jgi:hypothetical protein
MSENQVPKSSESSLEIIYPTAQGKQSPLSEFAPEIKDLLRSDSEATKRVLITVLDGMRSEQDIRREKQQQEFELKNKAIEQSHAIAKMRETRRNSETTAQKNTSRLVIGAITFAFAGSLGYGLMYKDTSLADKIFTGAMGIIGGAGSFALTRKKDKDDEKLSP